MIRSYEGMLQYESFEDRYLYLKLKGSVGAATFGYERHLNQLLYRSSRWRSLRDDIIVRDGGWDLGCDGYPIYAKVLVHHINPITLEDIELDATCVFDKANLVSTSLDTHNAIHFGKRLKTIKCVTRTDNDTSPWLTTKRGV
jgi:hypothetical protein